MSNQDNSPEVIANPSYTSKSELERLFSVFDGFKRDAEEIKSSLAKDVTSSDRPVLTMSSLGKLGRFGNQLFQYAFLRICAEKSGARVECPPWIGQTLFGHKDATISQQLPPAIERWEVFPRNGGVSGWTLSGTNWKIPFCSCVATIWKALLRNLNNFLL